MSTTRGTKTDTPGPHGGTPRTPSRQAHIPTRQSADCQSAECLLADELAQVLARRGLAFARNATEYSLPGSPERCLRRHVVADESKRLWLVECLTGSQRIRRETIGALLQSLATGGAEWIPAPLPLADGSARAVETSGQPWQVAPFFMGTELPRPAYLQQGWRGSAVARLLSELHAASALLPKMQAPMLEDNVPEDAATVEGYVRHMRNTIARRHPLLSRDLAPVLRVLDSLPDVIAAQPSTLAHGDLHPLNIIWLPDGISGVIDWEFTGTRPVLYDTANCLGCCGFEHPSGLVDKLALALTGALRDNHIDSSMLRLLPDMVMASRFGWLSEWLRKRDHAMLDMELDYLRILLENRKLLADLWSGARIR